MPRERSALLVWLLLVTVSGALLLRAWLDPPKGTAFVGTFYLVDDFYNYLSHVEQAQRGALLFRSKLAPAQLPPALLNLEWLGVGWLAVLLGGRAVLAYRLFGLIAAGALVGATGRVLARSGVSPSRRLPALLLVFTGGGLGGALLALGRLPGERAWDVRTGAFPFVEVLANPHFVVGTTLLLLAISAFATGRHWSGAALGVALGLVRPYDAALLAAVETLAVAASSPAREWPRRLLPVAVFSPVLAYSAWLFLLAPGFRVFSNPAYAHLAPSLQDLSIALGPATILASTAWPAWRRATAEARAPLLRLALWAAVALFMVVLRPVSFSLQFLAGIGLPLLGLAAVGLAARRGLLEAAVPLMATTGLFVSWLCTQPIPGRYVPAERLQLVAGLRRLCAPGQLLLAPPDIGLYAGGLTPCWPYVSHAAAPGFLARAQRVRTFYDPTTLPEERSRILEDVCPRHVLLPPTIPDGWLGTRTVYRPRLVVTGGNESLAVWARDDDAAACARPPS